MFYIYTIFSMKKLLTPIVVFTIVLLVSSCSGSKQIAYFQNADTVDLTASQGLYDAKIMPKDMLTITVSTTTPEAAVPFNLSVSNTVSEGKLSSGAGSLQTYLVDNDGNINFPVVGKVHVVGLTKNQCQDLILDKIRPYLAVAERPVVTVRMSSFRVTITGEVRSPGVIPVSTEKISIVEALASAGDLSLYGKRNNIMLIREDEKGQKSIHRINMNDANLINSPYYYLQQNDIIYVQPNGVQSKNSGFGQSTTIWFSLLSITMSVASFMINILRN